MNTNTKHENTLALCVIILAFGIFGWGLFKAGVSLIEMLGAALAIITIFFWEPLTLRVNRGYNLLKEKYARFVDDLGPQEHQPAILACPSGGAYGISEIRFSRNCIKPKVRLKPKRAAEVLGLDPSPIIKAQGGIYVSPSAASALLIDDRQPRIGTFTG